jgi:hypothetical protein
VERAKAGIRKMTILGGIVIEHFLLVAVEGA